ncbi:MAG: hypothetical protein K2O00_00605 [Muribaculaceae bacterium]|nr:hypothetical protein [Muribaculaceae bacterium]
MANNNENIRSEERRKPNVMNIIFGVIMIVIYVGMGVLLLCTQFFANVITIDWIRYLLGSVFIVYGFWRAYRQFRNNIN